MSASPYRLFEIALKNAFLGGVLRLFSLFAVLVKIDRKLLSTLSTVIIFCKVDAVSAIKTFPLRDVLKLKSNACCHSCPNDPSPFVFVKLISFAPGTK